MTMLDRARVLVLQSYALTHPCAVAGQVLGPRHFLDTYFAGNSGAGIRVALSLNK